MPITYTIMSYKDFYDKYKGMTPNDIIKEAIFLSKPPVEYDGKFTIALDNGQVIGRTGIEYDDPYPEFSGTYILPDYRNKKICKPLVEHMLRDFLSWEQQSVIMTVVSKMEAAAFCYIKAALALNYTVNIYDRSNNTLKEQITGVSENLFIFSDATQKHINEYKNEDISANFCVTFLFSKPAATVVGGGNNFRYVALRL